jgi:hypothetical protein
MRKQPLKKETVELRGIGKHAVTRPPRFAFGQESVVNEPTSEMGQTAHQAGAVSCPFVPRELSPNFGDGRAGQAAAVMG